MTKPRIAILGAGPTGLEAALAAVDSGLAFTVYEASPEIAGHVRSWGHVRLFSPWSMNVSARMRRHLEAAGLAVPSADDASCPTGAELIETILQPVAELPAIAPHLQTGVRVREIGRQGLLKHEEIASERRAKTSFRLLLERSDGEESTVGAEVVLDCTGSYGNPNTLGDGGIAAPGENALGERILRQIPDFLKEPESWAGSTVLLVGAGHSAQTAAIDLARFAELYPGTRVLWAQRKDETPSVLTEDDALPERARLVAKAARVTEDADGPVETLRGVVVDALARKNGKIAVTLRHTDGTTSAVVVDRVLSLTGSVGDHSLYRQLQVHECYATSGPMKLAAALLGSASQDCLDQGSHGADALLNPEPNFFILGAKSYGRNATFLMRVGWEQVAEVFGVLTGRERF
jgi:thioredoxin reductase